MYGVATAVVDVDDAELEVEVVLLALEVVALFFTVIEAEPVAETDVDVAVLVVAGVLLDVVTGG